MCIRDSLEGVRVLVRAQFADSRTGFRAGRLRAPSNDDYVVVGQIAQSFTRTAAEIVKLSRESFVDVPGTKLTAEKDESISPLVAARSAVNRIVDLGRREPIGLSTLNAKFFSVRGDIYDSSTEKKIGSVPLPKSFERLAISPEGKQLAVGRRGEANDEPGVIEIYSIENPKARPVTIEFSGGSVPDFAFVGETRLVAGSLKIWGTKTGREIKEMKLDGKFPPAAVSSNGRHIAMYDGNEVGVIDVSGSKVIATMSVPKGGTRSVFSDYISLAFSPDGQELAGVHKKAGLIVWSRHGDILLESDLGGRIAWNSRYNDTYLQWLPDGRGWLVDNRFLVLRKRNQVVWELEPPEFRREVTTAILTSDKRVLVSNEKSLLGIDIPWDKINAGLKALEGDDLLVGPGKKIDVVITVDSVRHSDQLTASGELQRVLNTKLNQNNIGVVRGSAVRLTVKHEEKRLGNDGGDDTFIKTNLQLMSGTEVLWKRELDVRTDPVAGRRTGAQLRLQAFEQLLSQLKDVRFPAKISLNPLLRLPIKTVIPKD